MVTLHPFELRNRTIERIMKRIMEGITEVTMEATTTEVLTDTMILDIPIEPYVFIAMLS